ncbi:MAG: sulfotransferase family protein, partial [Caulobacteraceae bacterium]
ASLERGLELDPNRVEALNVLSTNKKFTTRDLPLIARMRACAERKNLGVSEQIAIRFALGKALDDLGAYGEAMAQFDAGNRLRASLGRLDRDLLERQTNHAIDITPPGFLERRSDLGGLDETPILIVGMPRSGTTLVEQILSSHPDVAPGGELPFWREKVRLGAAVFGPDAPAEGARRLANDYLAVLRAISPSAARVTDKTPFNFAHLGLVRQTFPRAAIVHCRRSPVDTCLSNYMTNFATRFDYACDRSDLVFFYRQYLRLMAHWREVLPAERFVEVEYEALIADPEPLTRALVAACGLEWADACLAPHRNPRAVRTASIWQARQPIYASSVARWRRYAPWLGELEELSSGEDGEAE